VPAAIRCQGASGPAAPFSLAWLLLLGALAGLAGPAQGDDSACPAARIDERAQVVYVYDGDTIKLADGRRVRLIGINTPELDHNGAAHEPFAAAARTALQDLAGTGNRIVELQLGSEHFDHYGRLLAHVFLQDGRNVAAALLQRGLATTLVVPPNTWGQACYQRLEDSARIDRLGLWDLPRYQAIDSRALTPELRGFHIIRGMVSAVHESGSSTWIELPGPLTLRVGRRDRVNFANGYLEQLSGKTVEARGWLKPHNRGLMMNIAHPAALALVGTEIQP